MATTGVTDMEDRVQQARAAERDGLTTNVWLQFSPVTVLGETVDERPTAYDDPFRVAREHWVLWQADVPFTINFRKRNPILGKPQLQSIWDENAGVWAAAAQASPAAVSPRPYKYDLAMLWNDREIIIADPLGIVERDPI